jgi:monoamine oxidase
MAGHAKLVAIYADAFWRDQGLSGDAISRLGPLVEIHDASPRDAAYGALFGFVGLPAGSPLREPARLAEAASAQLGKLFGPVAARPLDIQIVDWARDPFTATPADAFSGEHPAYGFPAPLAALAARGLVMASTEVATGSGGFIEGALEASEYALTKLS